MSNEQQKNIPSARETYAEVKKNNRLRKQFSLPPLDLRKEMDRVRQVRADRTFEEWMKSPLRFRVAQKMLERWRRSMNDPKWKPTGMLSGGGWAFHIRLVQQMRRLKDRLGG